MEDETAIKILSSSKVLSEEISAKQVGKRKKVSVDSSLELKYFAVEDNHRINLFVYNAIKMKLLFSYSQSFLHHLSVVLNDSNVVLDT